MDGAGAQYVIAGGLATQLHVSDPRFTRDVDVVARADDAPLQPLLAEVYAESQVSVDEYPDFDQPNSANG